MKIITKNELIKLRDNEMSVSKVNLDLIQEIISQVQKKGDTAVKRYSELFDNISLDQIKLDESIIKEIASNVSDEIKVAIDQAYENIYSYHVRQKPNDINLETMPGIRCELRYKPIENVGVYIPGGTAVLFSSLLMTAIPSIIAGNERRIMCTPPSKDGKISPFLAYTALKCNTNEIYLVGGAQAIAAMAYGTETIPKVDKIFGPGNRYVTLAKQVIANQTRTAIDMPAGPSEVLIISDESSNAEILAADLLSQLEHGDDSSAVLLCTDKNLIEKTQIEIKSQIKNLSRKETIKKSLNQCYFIAVNSIEEAIDTSNQFAPEHLIISTRSFKKDIDSITKAGSIFLSQYSAESFGDYASGTNHTLPTMGLANAYSGITVNDFYLSQMIQEINKKGLNDLGPIVRCLADAEELDAHAEAITKRLALLGGDNA